MSVTQEQAATIRQYLNGIPGHVTIKTAMLGQGDVGKGRIILRLNGNDWLGLVHFDPTAGEQFHIFTHLDDKVVMFEGELNTSNLAWGPTDYPPGISTYNMARHCEVCIFVYRVTSRASFERVNTYYLSFFVERSIERPYRSKPLERATSPPRPPFRGVFVLIANKFDEKESHWTVSTQEGEKLGASMGAMFFQMSAKTGQGAGLDVVADIARHVLLWRIHNRSESGERRRAPARPLDYVLQGSLRRVDSSESE